MEEVTCRLQYSGAAQAFLALAVVATLAMLLLVPFPQEARAVLCAWVVAGAACARAKLRRTRWLLLSTDGSIEAQLGDRVRAGRVVPGSFVAPWLTIVNWRPDGARLGRTLVILPGMATTQELRRIRVILRWG